MTYAPITASTLIVWAVATSPIWGGLAFVVARATRRRNR